MDDAKLAASINTETDTSNALILPFVLIPG
jgi:hypothetical protein